MSRSFVAAAACALLVPGAALACGGFFASRVKVDPAQSIVVVRRDGVETYIFRPHFCGEAKEFGLILPIPATLSSPPALADTALYDQLATFTAPEVEEVCQPSSVGCGGMKGAALAGGMPPDAVQNVNVVEQGTVGQFDYVLLQAATVNAFTDWLDQNGFPHGVNTEVFQSYVTKQWYFVAFKVTAAANAPPAGSLLCGDLGPIQLSFAAAQPVVPSRIATVNAEDGAPTWRVFYIAASQQKLAAGGYQADLYFSKTLSQSELGSAPAMAALSRDGERLTVLDVRFVPVNGTDDLATQDDPNPVDFRLKTKVYKDCSLGSGCAAGGAIPNAFAAVAVLAMLSVLRRIAVRRRRA